MLAWTPGPPLHGVSGTEMTGGHHRAPVGVTVVWAVSLQTQANHLAWELPQGPALQLLRRPCSLHPAQWPAQPAAAEGDRTRGPCSRTGRWLPSPGPSASSCWKQLAVVHFSQSSSQAGPWGWVLSLTFCVDGGERSIPKRGLCFLSERSEKKGGPVTRRPRTGRRVDSETEAGLVAAWVQGLQQAWARNCPCQTQGPERQAGLLETSRQRAAGITGFHKRAPQGSHGHLEVSLEKQPWGTLWPGST